MKQRNSKWALLAPAAAASVMFLIQPVRAEVMEKTKEGRRHDRALQGRPSQWL